MNGQGLGTEFRAMPSLRACFQQRQWGQNFCLDSSIYEIRVGAHDGLPLLGRAMGDRGEPRGCCEGTGSRAWGLSASLKPSENI